VWWRARKMQASNRQDYPALPVHSRRRLQHF